MSVNTNTKDVQIKLAPTLLSQWPKLAWVATMALDRYDLQVYHGPHVETGEDWLVEAVWNGDFEAGDFDLTELVFGTGIRIRDNHVVFVSAGTMMDRLYSCQLDQQWFVGNSLPAVLACSGMSLDDEYPGYSDDIRTQMSGLNNYKRTLPTVTGEIQLTYYRNIQYNGENLVEIDKPNTTPSFTSYGKYCEFLVATAKSLQRNLESSFRAFSVQPLTTVSKGYDSCAVAAIVSEAGVQHSVTIENASSLLPRTDSGAEIAEHLGLSCQAYRHSPDNYRHEVKIWAAAGDPAGLNLTIFNYPKQLCVFFTGYRGDSLWQRERQDRSQPFRARSLDGLSMTEFRLHEGVFHCPVPFWGSLNAEEIQAIGFSEEMSPWTLGSTYDRPIPRRILENAGVPRQSFGIRKGATFAPRAFFWPFGGKEMASFRGYLQQRGICAPKRWVIWLLRRLAHIDQLISVNLSHFLGRRIRGLRPYIDLRGQKLLFQWANHTLKQRYGDALPKANSDPLIKLKGF